MSSLVLLILLCAVIHVKCDCTLNLQNELPKPQPVFLQNGGILAPNAKTGKIFVKHGETLDVSCTGRNTYILLNGENTHLNLATAQCIDDKTFKVDKWKGDFRNITCNYHPAYDVEQTTESCYGGNKIYRVGYKVNHTFYKLYDVCFDRRLMASVFTRHTLEPSSIHGQGSGGKRPQFVEGGMFDTLAMADLYKTKNQRNRINYLLGDDMDKVYFSKKQFLNRGHLSPRADFSLESTQRPSFLYANTAPQWSRGNAGDWASLEYVLRKRVKALGRSVQIYTGTFGVTSLPDKDGVHRDIYLDDDINNNQLVPVPMYFYKIIHDPTTKTATAFVSINSPFYKADALKNLTICSDICQYNPKLSWVKWRDNDGTTSFCCDLPEFSKNIPHFSSLDIRDCFY